MVFAITADGGQRLRSARRARRVSHSQSADCRFSRRGYSRTTTTSTCRKAHHCAVYLSLPKYFKREDDGCICASEEEENMVRSYSQFAGRALTDCHLSRRLSFRRRRRPHEPGCSRQRLPTTLSELTSRIHVLSTRYHPSCSWKYCRIFLQLRT